MPMHRSSMSGAFFFRFIEHAIIPLLSALLTALATAAIVFVSPLTVFFGIPVTILYIIAACAMAFGVGTFLSHFYFKMNRGEPAATTNSPTEASDGDDAVLETWKRLTGNQSWQKEGFSTLRKDPDSNKQFCDRCQSALRKALPQVLNDWIAKAIEKGGPPPGFIFENYQELLHYPSPSESNIFRKYKMKLTPEEQALKGGATWLTVYNFQIEPTKENVQQTLQESFQGEYRNGLPRVSRFNALIQYKNAYYYFEKGQLTLLALPEANRSRLTQFLGSPRNKEGDFRVFNDDQQEEIGDMIGRHCPLSRKRMQELFLKRCPPVSNPSAQFTS